MYAHQTFYLINAVVLEEGLALEHSEVKLVFEVVCMNLLTCLAVQRQCGRVLEGGEEVQQLYRCKRLDMRLSKHFGHVLLCIITMTCKTVML